LLDPWPQSFCEPSLLGCNTLLCDLCNNPSQNKRHRGSGALVSTVISLIAKLDLESPLAKVRSRRPHDPRSLLLRSREPQDARLETQPRDVPMRGLRRAAQPRWPQDRKGAPSCCDSIRRCPAKAKQDNGPALIAQAHFVASYSQRAKKRALAIRPWHVEPRYRSGSTAKRPVRAGEPLANVPWAVEQGTNYLMTPRPRQQ
jgi:hypothetical protein